MQKKGNFWKFYGFLSVLMLNFMFFGVCSGQSMLPGTPQKTAGTEIAVLGASDYQKASASKKSRKEILGKIPFKSLTPDAQQKVMDVLKNVSMYRRLPVQIVPCEKVLYDFMTYHPDTMVNIWELMGVSQMMLRQVGPDVFYMEDQAGTRGQIECLYRSPDLMLIYVYGSYEGVPFPKKVSGSGLMVLQNQQLRSTSGEKLLAIRLDAFMQIENNGVETLAKTFQPLVGNVADSNLNQVAGFLGRLSETAVENGLGVAHMARRLERVTPEVREEFAEVALLVAGRSAPINAPAPMPLASPVESAYPQPVYSAVGSRAVPEPAAPSAPTAPSSPSVPYIPPVQGTNF